MDAFVYNLFLKSRAGLSLFGVLRYQLTSIEVNQVGDGNIFTAPLLRQAHDGPPQQQENIHALVMRAEGTVMIPLLTGFKPMAVEDVAFFIQMGAPIVTRLVSKHGTMALCFNQINNQQIGGGLMWGPGNTSCCLMGRRQILPS